jgi:hypothetical protein
MEHRNENPLILGVDADSLDLLDEAKAPLDPIENVIESGDHCILLKMGASLPGLYRLPSNVDFFV